MRRIADIYGTDATLDAAETLLGYPASWADSHGEHSQILDYLETQTNGH